MDAIERVEIWLRTQLTYELAHHCGPFGYVDRSTFPKNFKHREFMKKLGEEEKRSTETFVQHFRRKYTGENHLPIWMASELMSFGTLSHLYSALPPNLKRRIAAQVEVADTVFGGWTHCLAYIRNICAHHSRLWNRQLAIRPRCPKRWVYGKTDNSRVYAVILVLDWILERIAPNNTWISRLHSLLDQSQSIDLVIMGFPPAWQELAPWKVD